MLDFSSAPGPSMTETCPRAGEARSGCFRGLVRVDGSATCPEGLELNRCGQAGIMMSESGQI